MVEYELKAGPQGHYYFPKKLRDVFGNKLKIIPDSSAGAIYPIDADLNRVVESLQIIIQDLKLRAKTRDENQYPRKGGSSSDS